MTGKEEVVLPALTIRYANTARSPGSSEALWPGWASVPSGVTLTAHTAETVVRTGLEKASPGSPSLMGRYSARA